MKKKVTMKAIANRVNLSQNTVSLVLRGRPGLREETRALVLQTAREMGYDFSRLEGEKPAICIATTIKNGTDTYFYTRFQQAIERELDGHHFPYIILNNIDNYEPHRLDELFEANRVGGVIIVGDISLALGKALKHSGQPMICAGFHLSGLSVDSVMEDNVAGMFSVVDYLLALGYGDIGYIGQATSADEGLTERWMAYMAGLKMRGKKAEERWMITDHDHDRLSDADQLERILRHRQSHPGAYVCSNDKVAMACVKALTALGLAVPGDIGVVGFDNSDLARLCMPTLTTVDNFSDYQAARTVARFIQRIEDIHLPVERILTHTRLVVGGSTRPPQQQP